MTEAEPVKSTKNQQVALVLAVLPGIIGFLGTGYLYLGRIGRGLLLLISGWAVIGISILCFMVWSMSFLVIPPHGEPMDPPPVSWIFLIVSVTLSIVYLALWVWQIINTRTVYRNMHVKG